MFPKDSNTYLSLKVASSRLKEWGVDAAERISRDGERDTGNSYFLPGCFFSFVVVAGLLIKALFEIAITTYCQMSAAHKQHSWMVPRRPVLCRLDSQSLSGETSCVIFTGQNSIFIEIVSKSLPVQ